MNKTRILIIANYLPDQGGISVVVENYYNQLIREGYHVMIYNTCTKRSMFKRIGVVFYLVGMIKRYDVVHLHGTSGLGFYPILIGIISSKMSLHNRTIVTFHGGNADSFLRNNLKWIRCFLNKADNVTVMSKYLHDVFKGYGISTCILKNITNFEVRPRSDKDYSYPRILSIRSLYERYNIPDIINAFREIQRDHPRAELTIAGLGPDLEDLQNLANGMANVRFLGLIKNANMQDLLQRNNILISVPSVDNQPMSIIEAFCSGILVISSKVGGVVDMIQDEYNGLLVEPSNPKQIEAKIRWVLQNPDKACRIVERGLETARSYTWEGVKPTLLKLYGIQECDSKV